MSDEKKSIESSKDDEKEQLESRRKALHKISIGIGAGAIVGFLPSKWVKPVVDSIIVPAHAQTSLPCECQLSSLAVNASANELSATYTWSNCTNIALARLVITGPGVDNPLGYMKINPSPSGSSTLLDVSPYNATVFQLGETYTFTLTLTDAGNNVLQTCIDTVIAAVPTN